MSFNSLKLNEALFKHILPKLDEYNKKEFGLVKLLCSYNKGIYKNGIMQKKAVKCGIRGYKRWVRTVLDFSIRI